MIRGCAKAKKMLLISLQMRPLNERFLIWFFILKVIDTYEHLSEAVTIREGTAYDEPLPSVPAQVTLEENVYERIAEDEPVYENIYEKVGLYCSCGDWPLLPCLLSP